ncbi:hypothetical protein PRIPAC_74898 [Pristionchus pacificus]|uniref:Uncharacterized protein n=1 Tax=Pristionchus pacificus TaxID=54126 RepID=A0A2A6BZ96_PRIPA|nr:hypothetical protein PRIPAC_74898 [Pristionchus pacificus]|eukprot:PDM71264.1 hypothetical protein PRIPAC_37671 [Pristionchus pacificus]
MIAKILRLCILAIALFAVCDAQIGQYFYGGPRVLTANSFYQYYRPYPSVLAYPGAVPAAAPVMAAAAAPIYGR